MESQEFKNNNLSEEKSTSKTKKILIPTFVGLLALAAAGGGTYYVYSTQVYTTCNVEAGVTVSANDFLIDSTKTAQFTSGEDSLDTAKPGDYTEEVKVGYFTHTCHLIVQDTISPELSLEPVTIEYGDTVTAEDFVLDITDATECTTEISSQIDYDLHNQSVTIAVTDLGGNTTEKSTELTINKVKSDISVEVNSDLPAADEFVIGEGTAEYVIPEETDDEEDTENAGDAENVDDSENAGDEASTAEEETGAEVYENPEEIDMAKVGDYELGILFDQEEYAVTLSVVDTVAPVIEVQDVDSFTTFRTDPADFIKSAEDATTLTYDYKEEPDFDKTGTQDVTITATDEGGNVTEAAAKLTLAVDDEAPVISSANDFTATIGDTIAYKSKVKVTDNCTEGLKIDVDTSGVNVSQVGTYPITYTATDASGNTTSVTINITIKEPSYTEDDLYPMCDQILASIISPGMDARSKCQAIYNYVTSHIAYSGHADKDGMVKAAIIGIKTGKGDCYTYASVSKYLLTRAGITNKDIEKIPSTTRHYWNLVDIGDGHGWYHFDTTPRKADHPVIFLWDDATLMAYSNSHGLTHNYDRTIYPGIL